MYNLLSDEFSTGQSTWTQGDMDSPNAHYAQWDEEPVRLTRAKAVSPCRVACNTELEGQSVRGDRIRYKGANSQPTLQVYCLLRISDFTLLQRTTLIQQQIWMNAGWGYPNPLLPKYIFSASTSSPSSPDCLIQHGKPISRRKILNVCPLRCSFTTGVKRHDTDNILAHAH